MTTAEQRLFTPGDGATPPALTGREREEAVLTRCLADLLGGRSSAAQRRSDGATRHRQDGAAQLVQARLPRPRAGSGRGELDPGRPGRPP